MLSSSAVSLSSSATAFSLYNTKRIVSTAGSRASCLRISSSPLLSLSSSLSLSHAFNPLSLRSLIAQRDERIAKSRSRGRGVNVVCSAVPLTFRDLRWISTVSSVVLILARGTPVHKSFLVPLFALQAPAAVIAWIKGTYGVWLAFVALLVRLFFYIPEFSAGSLFQGELELPFLALLLVILSPYEVMRFRDTKEGAIISLLIAVYLAYQHFSRTSLQKSLDQGSIVATIAVVCITIASLLLLI
ncbi:cold-regulated 413 inner membrane protein 1, chloroplastic isoform X1 [Arachis ipaensis]|uniref:cold-regulated 413 inner membrane protein 1, chloroplastic isoform X1 n=1 Tax=Arachis ipaensis TaxID=130454 RepID=UPI000A2B1A10|nr:cold-regulated 413 inner membrane protein 1, chloroplastic isoform X1 [Arachis ipaensis]